MLYMYIYINIYMCVYMLTLSCMLFHILTSRGLENRRMSL